MASKIDRITNLSKDKLLDIVSKILQSLGFNVEDYAHSHLIATKNDGIGEVKYAIGFLLESPTENKEDEFEATLKFISALRKESKVSQTILVTSYYFSKGLTHRLNNEISGLVVWDRDELISKIDQHYPDFWRHDDQTLVAYEKQFVENSQDVNVLKDLKLSDDKYQRILKVHIEPSLVYYYEENKKPIRKRLSVAEVINQPNPIIIDGISGSGKTTLLYEIGVRLIDGNREDSIIKKSLPVFISAIDLVVPNVDLKQLIENKLIEFRKKFNELISEYNVILLIDSIDELDEFKQKRIIKDLDSLYDKGLKYYIGSRQGRYLSTLSRTDVKNLEITSLKLDQIKRFISAFLSDEEKSNQLLIALRDNKILEKLPITPLTLSLITILYEELNVEIPATLTDIYDKFNELIMGRAVVSSKLQLIDVNFREDVLETYALHLLESKDHNPLETESFINYFKDIYKDVLPPKMTHSDVEEALRYIVKNTGILNIKDSKWVCFSHNSYMEYYASRAIFKNHRDKETELVNNFFDVNWQNVGIFYAGKTKKMPDFVNQIITKVNKAYCLPDMLSSIQGLGYLLQTLYLTDNEIRSNAILSALELTVRSYYVLRGLCGSQDTVNGMLRFLNIPLAALINFMHFYGMFNSITLTEPLIKAFDSLKTDLDVAIASNDREKISNIGFKMIDVAFTLSSRLINKPEYLTKVIETKEIMNDPLLLSIADVSVSWFGNNIQESIKRSIASDKKSKKEVLVALSNYKPSKFRQSPLDTIMPTSKIKLIVEGKTDVKIIEHAYSVLTNGNMPYWNIRFATQNGTTGSCKCVKEAIENSRSTIEDGEIYIGLLDYDAAGLAQYGLLSNNIEEIESKSIKKLNGINSYLLLLPVPGEFDNYIKKQQEFNFFEIEHYFGKDYLEQHGMLEKTEMPDIYKIKDSNKDKDTFSEIVLNENDPKIFKYFIDLFEKIDSITGMENQYML